MSESMTVETAKASARKVMETHKARMEKLEAMKAEAEALEGEIKTLRDRHALAATEARLKGSPRPEDAAIRQKETDLAELRNTLRLAPGVVDEEAKHALAPVVAFFRQNAEETRVKILEHKTELKGRADLLDRQIRASLSAGDMCSYVKSTLDTFGTCAAAQNIETFPFWTFKSFLDSLDKV